MGGAGGNHDGTGTPQLLNAKTPTGRGRAAPVPPPRLTLQLEQRVVHLALDLPRALHGARHPQPLVERLGRHDIVPRVGCHLPLGHGGADDDADPAQESQHEAQELQTPAGHVYAGLLRTCGG